MESNSQFTHIKTLISAFVASVDLLSFQQGLIIASILSVAKTGLTNFRDPNIPQLVPKDTADLILAKALTVDNTVGAPPRTKEAILNAGKSVLDVLFLIQKNFASLSPDQQQSFVRSITNLSHVVVLVKSKVNFLQGLKAGSPSGVPQPVAGQPEPVVQPIQPQISQQPTPPVQQPARHLVVQPQPVFQQQPIAEPQPMPKQPASPAGTLPVSPPETSEPDSRPRQISGVRKPVLLAAQAAQSAQPKPQPSSLPTAPTAPTLPTAPLNPPSTPVSKPAWATNSNPSSPPASPTSPGSPSRTQSNSGKFSCHFCSKTVFHAEKQEFDGKLFHPRCFNQWKKEEELQKRLRVQQRISLSTSDPTQRAQREIHLPTDTAEPPVPAQTMTQQPIPQQPIPQQPLPQQPIPPEIWPESPVPSHQVPVRTPHSRQPPRRTLTTSASERSDSEAPEIEPIPDSPSEPNPTESTPTTHSGKPTWPVVKRVPMRAPETLHSNDIFQGDVETTVRPKDTKKFKDVSNQISYGIEALEPVSPRANDSPATPRTADKTPPRLSMKPALGALFDDKEPSLMHKPSPGHRYAGRSKVFQTLQDLPDDEGTASKGYLSQNLDSIVMPAYLQEEKPHSDPVEPLISARMRQKGSLASSEEREINSLSRDSPPGTPHRTDTSDVEPAVVLKTVKLDGEHETKDKKGFRLKIRNMSFIQSTSSGEAESGDVDSIEKKATSPRKLARKNTADARKRDKHSKAREGKPTPNTMYVSNLVIEDIPLRSIGNLGGTFSFIDSNESPGLRKMFGFDEQNVWSRTINPEATLDNIFKPKSATPTTTRSPPTTSKSETSDSVFDPNEPSKTFSEVLQIVCAKSYHEVPEADLGTVVKQVLVLASYLATTVPDVNIANTLRSHKEDVQTGYIQFHSMREKKIDLLTYISRFVLYLKQHSLSFQYLSSQNELESDYSTLWSSSGGYCVNLPSEESESVYWDASSIDNEIRDIVSGMSSDAFKVKYAKFNQLLLLLTDPNCYDPNFMKIFFFAYVEFCAPSILFRKLFFRFTIPSNNDPLGKNVKNRVINAMKYWMKSRFSDFDQELVANARAFIDHLNFVKHPAGIALASVLRSQQNSLESAQSPYTKKEKIFVLSEVPVQLDISKHTSEEIAQALCMIEFESWKQLKPADLIQYRPRKKVATNALLDEFIGNFNAVSQWVRLHILSQANLQARARVLTKFMEIAIALNNYNNFNSLFAVASAISSSPISRLKWTKGEISEKLQQEWAAVSDLLSPSQNYSTYRALIKQRSPPLLPYLGQYLTDIVMIGEGNPNFAMGLINFHKVQLLYKVAAEIELTQTTPYAFPKVNSLMLILANLKEENEDEFTERMFSLSLEREPRGTTDRRTLQ